MKKLSIVSMILVAALVSCRRDAATSEGIQPSVDTVQTSATTPGTNVPPVTTGAEPPPPRDAAPAPTQVIIDGQPIYRAHCDGCHGPAGRAPAGGVVLASPATQSKSIDELARIIREGTGQISRTAHPQVGLSDEEVRKVAAYVKAMN